MKYLLNPPQIGEKYRVEYNGQELYDAVVLEHEGGCWAKVKIDTVLPSPQEKMYKPGMEFDLKLSHYNLYEFDQKQ